MWEENIDVLQEQIADVQAGIIAVQNRGKIIASRIGLPEEKFFSGTSLDNSCETLPSVTQVPESIDETAALGADKMSALQRSLQGITRRYDILAVRGTQQRVAFDTVPMQQPLEKKHRQTSGFGYRKDPFTGRRAFHSGYDYSARRGTPVLAAATGFVTYSGRLGNYGKAIRIFHGDNISTLYGHLHATGVEIGQYVLRGEPIGEVGSTGRSTGSHLHYELRINNKPRPIARVIKELLAARNIHDDWDA
jgi:murein DD-endopeptidase MepM/ murein hydrolase activator NlpD